MKRIVLILSIAVLCLGLCLQNSTYAQLPEEDYFTAEEMNDPGEKINRKTFWANNKLYDGLKYPAKLWRKIMPAKAREGIKGLYKTYSGWPGVVVNSGLQGEWKEMAVEIVRPVVELPSIPTLGIMTISDKIGLPEPERKRNFDSTLQKYNVPYGIYIVWPLLGPNSLRGTFGKIGDTLLNPVSYFLLPFEAIGVAATDEFNRYSINLEQYEDFDKAALDYYIAVRNAYFQSTERKENE